MEESESPKNPKPDQTQRLLTQLVILSILIIGLILLVAAYPRIRLPFRAQVQGTALTQRPTLTPTNSPTVTLTPTPTRTLRFTLTPTLTLTSGPSLTPSPTSTLPGPPTITPARPLPNDKAYSLKTWTAEEADLAARYMEDFPNLLSPIARGNDNSGFYSSFTYAVFALKEALLRFPDSELVEGWQWRLALNQARAGDPEVAETYSDLISSNLNRGDTDLSTLRYWFKSQEPSLDLYDIPMDPPSGYTGSSLLQIQGPGSIFLWLLEKSGVYEVIPLSGASEELFRFDFVNPTKARVLLSDLNGDGQDELVIFQEKDQANFTLTPPRVFDVSEVPAQEISYEIDPVTPDLGIEFENLWSIEQNDQGGNDLVFNGRAFPACSVAMQFKYRWNGAAFERISKDLNILPDPASASHCKILVEYAAEFWGTETAALLIEDLLPFWPPELDETGKMLSLEDAANSKDELRFRLGVYSALTSDSEKAKQILNDLITNPGLPTSKWTEPAKEFLNLYQNPGDIYRACLSTPFCKPSEALQLVSNSFPKEANENPIQLLSDLGVSLISAGYADFDLDGTTERWFTTRHRPLEKPDLWIIAQTPSGPRLVNVGTVDQNKPAWETLEQENGVPIIQLDSLNKFVFLRRVEDKAPFLIWLPGETALPNRFLKELDQLENALLGGEDPTVIQEELQKLAKSSGLPCRVTWSCDRYYYLLGLASELAKNERTAVEAFLYLWRNYFRSPFTILARLKLEGAAISLTTPLSPTPTATITLTPTIGPSPTPTATSQPYPYPYPNPYPYPYP